LQENYVHGIPKGTVEDPSKDQGRTVIIFRNGDEKMVTRDSGTVQKGELPPKHSCPEWET